MSNIEMETAFKSLNEFLEVEAPVALKEEAPAAETVFDLFKNESSYNVIHNFDVDGQSCGIYAEATHDGDSCDAIFGEFKEENINGVIIDVMDAEGNLQGTLDSVGLDTKVSEVEILAEGLLGGEPSEEPEQQTIQKEIEEPKVETSDEEDNDTTAETTDEDKVEIKYKDKRITISDIQLQESQKIDLSEPKEVEKAKEMMDTKQNGESVEQIVDVSAEAVDDLKKSYIGSAILQCPTCHTMIYKDIDGLTVSDEASTDEEKIYNIDEECPHCGAKDGYELIGQVASLDIDADGNPVEETEVEPASEDVTNEDAAPEEAEEKESSSHLDVGMMKEAIDMDKAPRAVDAVSRFELTPDERLKLIKGVEDGVIVICDRFFRPTRWDGNPGKKTPHRFTPDELRELNTPDSKWEYVWYGEPNAGNLIIDSDGGIHHQIFGNSQKVLGKKVLGESSSHLDVGMMNDLEVIIESIGEESFDRLVTNYLKENYSNVKSYKTTSANMDDAANVIALEGVISFKSGKEKPTKFVFEAKGLSKSGKVKFCGINESFSSKKAYNLIAGVKDGKLLSESLSYSYSIDGNKVAGRVSLPKKR